MLKKTLFTIVLCCTVAISTTSCFKEEDYMYSELVMVNVLSSTSFQNDVGTIYNVVENGVGQIPSSVKRMMINCDVLRNTQGFENEYDIRLNEFAEALVKEPVNSSEADEEELGDDPIQINQGWMSLGYFNALLQTVILSGSQQEHAVSLVYDELKSNTDTLYFTLRHNAFGDSLESEENRHKEYNFTNGYFSFPIDKYVPAGTKSIVFHFDWEWYFTDGTTITFDHVKNSGDLKYILVAD